jgi:hypothetical protein
MWLVPQVSPCFHEFTHASADTPAQHDSRIRMIRLLSVALFMFVCGIVVSVFAMFL